MEKERLHNQITKKHGIAVSENDPIWIVATVTEYIAESYREQLEQHENIFKEELISIKKSHINRTNVLHLTIAGLTGVVVGIIISLIIK